MWKQFPYTKKQIAAAFTCATVEYTQRIILGGKGAGIELTAFPAGHAIGGSVWRITLGADAIVYAGDFNHANECYLAGSPLREPQRVCARPSLFITDASNALVRNPKRQDRETALFDRIDRALLAGGNVLVPTDAAGRVLELALNLDQHWAACQQQLRPFGLVLYSRTARDILTSARTLGWQTEARDTDGALPASAASGASGGAGAGAGAGGARLPFDFRFVRVATTEEELAAVPRPMCILAAGESLEVGSTSLAMFERMCSLPMDLVMLTSVGAPESLTRCLVDNVHNPPPTVTVQNLCATRLSDAEIQKIEDEKRSKQQQQEQQQQQQEQEQQAQKQEQKQEQDQKDENGDDEKEGPEESTSAQPEVPVTPVLGLQSSAVNPLTTHYDATPASFAAAGLKFPMYPCEESTFLCDVFGQILDLDDYIVADADGADASDGEGSDGARSGGSEEHAERADPYTTYTVENSQLVVRCQMAFVDMEGRSDGESLLSVCTKLAPVRLVVLYGRTNDGRRAADALVERCCAALQPRLRAAFVAETGRPVVLEPETQSFRANMSKELLDSVRFERVGDGTYEIAYITAQGVPAPDPGSLVTLVPADPSTAQPAQPTQQQQQQQQQQIPDVTWRDTAFVGGLRMDELIQALTTKGFRACFTAGSVIAVNDGAVRIRKEDGGGPDESDAQLHVVLEGRLCADYYRVRDLLYEHFKLV